MPIPGAPHTRQAKEMTHATAPSAPESINLG